MTTKEQVLTLISVERFGKFVNQINFEALDKFVQMLVAGYISRKGQETIKNDIDLDMSGTDTSNFLTHIIEVGTLKILTDNNMIGVNKNENNAAIVTVAFSINVSLAYALKSKNVYSLDTPIYYSINALKTIVDRIANNIDSSIQDQTYVKSLVNTYLMNKI